MWHHFKNILPLKSVVLGVNGSLKSSLHPSIFFCYHIICHNVKWWWNGYGLGFSLSRWGFNFHFEHFTIMTYMIKNNHGDMVRNNNNNNNRHESWIWWFVDDLLIILHPFFFGMTNCMWQIIANDMTSSFYEWSMWSMHRMSSFEHL